MYQIAKQSLKEIAKEAKQNYNKSNKIIGYNPEAKNKKTKVNANPTNTEKTYHNSWELFLGLFTSSAVRKEYVRFMKNFFKR